MKHISQNNFIRFFLGFITLGVMTGGLMMSVANAADPKSNVPNYATGVAEVNKQLYTGEHAIKVDAHDRAAMDKAAHDLAQQMPHPGLKVGEKAPDFTLKNPFGKQVRLANELAKGPVVLVFYRGAWCPYCNLQMHQLQTILPQIKKYGARIVAVTPQQPDKSLAQFKKAGYPFEVLSDLDYKIIKTYKLYWEVSDELDQAYKHTFGLDVTTFNGKGRRGLPIPATYVLDKSGVIRAAYADTNYQTRMEPADLLAALEMLGH